MEPSFKIVWWSLSFLDCIDLLGKEEIFLIEKMLKFKRKKYVDFFYLSKYMYTLKLKKSMLELELDLMVSLLTIQPP